ncbi:hypothetical protein Nepgr_016069 [Nepenthes gracilis]|uniref:Uncharacterized protein n=1 Tax=Nepenthes gracilis TaxID=150966 RepID=A0AAD3SMU7_NEPGR|nr:hypothetical protein Nepgr_016069 [Nepenthes gracilis]
MAEPQTPERSETHSEKKVKVPNLIGRFEGETDSVMGTKKSTHHHKETHGTSEDIDENTSTDEVKGPNVLERVKEEFEAIIEAIHPKKNSNEIDVKETEAAICSKKSPHHHKETHGTSDEINDKTAVDEVKGPNVFERVKEEFEAIVEAVSSKRDGSD